MMDETDIVTGRHLKKIPKAVKEICDSLEKKPTVVMICLPVWMHFWEQTWRESVEKPRRRQVFL